MAVVVTFNGEAKTIVISDSGNVTITAKEIYSRWKEWVLTNPQWEPAFRTFGGDPLGGGLFAGDYYFLNNVAGWKIKPQEKNHTLTINGNLFGEDAESTIFIQTDGGFNVNIRQGYSSLTQLVSSGGSSGGGLTTNQAKQLEEIHQIQGLDSNNPLTYTPTSKITGDIEIQVTGDQINTATLTRQ